MGRTSTVEVRLTSNNSCFYSGVTDWLLDDAGTMVVLKDGNRDIAVVPVRSLQFMSFLQDTEPEPKPEPPEDYALGHKDDEKTGFSAGDRAVVTLPGDRWRNMTVDILGPLTFPPNTFATKIRGEVLVSVYHRDNLRPVPEERRNESR